MPRVLIFALCIASAAAQFVTPVPSVVPTWLVPYPGVSAQARRLGNSVEFTYTVPAQPRDVLTHFRTLFASAGLPFQPSPAGHGFLINADPPECDLNITIERFDPDTRVKVTCSPRFASTDRILKEHEQKRAAQAQNDPMKRFDTPVYPDSKAPAAPLTWPSWLVRVDGAKLPIEKFAGQLRSSFVSAPTREAIQAFYAGLLSSHNFRVSQSVAAAPEKFGSWVQGSSLDGGSSHRNVVWVKIRPSGQNFAVEISVQ